MRRSSLSALFLVAACGGGAPEPARPTPGPGVAGTKTEGQSPTGRAGPLPKGQTVGSPKAADRRNSRALAPDTLGVMQGRSAAPPRTSAEVYRAVAPAVVIIRAGGGMGSGVVIDPAGWIVTNNHVIDGGDREDFKVKVSVVVGKIDFATGSMEREAKEHVAYVYKADKLRDLALIKLQDPPPGLVAAPIAKENPVPGQPVLAIGHAGAGMLWAIKPGEISALGKLRDHLATLAQFRDDEEGKQAADQFRKHLDEQNLGLVIQSTCQILPGDSGGPLLSRAGEVVGLNAFSNRDGRTGGLLNFHIHRQEIADFVAQRPATPTQLIPDAWAEGGAELSLDDADLDGAVDVLLMAGRRACSYCPRQSGAVFIDLDQDSFPGGIPVPPLSEVYEKRRFDAEVIYLEAEGKAYVWYDTDADGRLDVLLHDATVGGETTSAYRVAGDGTLTRDDALTRGRDIRPSLFREERHKRRLAGVAAAAFTGRNVEAGWLVSELPRPVAAAGEGRTEDLDEDGRPESVRVSTAFSTRLFVDADRSAVGTLPSSFHVGRDVQSGAIDGDLTVITQSDDMWVWYDTDADSAYDLVLHAAGQRAYVATEAFRLDAAGQRTPAPEHLGRKVVRAALLPAGAERTQGAACVEKSFLPILAASTDGGVASFPDPIKDSRGVAAQLLEVAGTKRAVATLQGYGSEAYLLDLDESSLRGKDLKKTDLDALLQQGKFGVDFAFFQRGGLAWAFYDTDGKAGFDVVLYTADPWSGKVAQAYRVDAGGAVMVDAALVPGAFVRPSLLGKSARGKQFAKLSGALFSERLREP